MMFCSLFPASGPEIIESETELDSSRFAGTTHETLKVLLFASAVNMQASIEMSNKLTKSVKIFIFSHLANFLVNKKTHSKEWVLKIKGTNFWLRQPGYLTPGIKGLGP